MKNLAKLQQKEIKQASLVKGGSNGKGTKKAGGGTFSNPPMDLL